MTYQSEQVEATANKRVQRRRGKPRKEVTAYTNAVVKELQNAPLNAVKKAEVPELSAMQRAILNVVILPGAINLSHTAIAEIVKTRYQGREKKLFGSCHASTVYRFWTSTKCMKALDRVRKRLFGDGLPDIYLKMRDMARNGDLRAQKLLLELKGDYTPAALQQITYNQQVNITAGEAARGFLETVGDLRKGISIGGGAENTETQQQIDADFEVVDESQNE